MARLLTDVIVLSSEKDSLSTGYIVESVVVEDMIILMKRDRESERFLIKERLQFMALFAHLCGLSAEIRQQVVAVGGAEVLVELGRELLDVRSEVTK